MSLSWFQRKERLSLLLKSHGDEDADGLALDRLLHGQNVIGKTSRTAEIDSLRFQNKDLNLVGTLDHGQFGVIDVVTCPFDGRVYVRKSIEKRFALRNRDQCFPVFERDILLQARKANSEWAPRLLCAFQTPTQLNLVMDYAQGGTLWDVLESSPHDGKILEKDLRWWTPQIVSAIHWCHSQEFVHRDIKPHNFVLTDDAHVLLIDFGSVAPLLPPDLEGAQKLPKRYCLVPCGTCDYISPEILQAHEEALVALELDDEDEDVAGSTPKCRAEEATEGYGLETDWWSLGAMLYELAYGVAPFFASDIRQTYLKIINHEKSLRFDKKVQLSGELKDFLSGLLTHPHTRLGRRSIMEITQHPVFNGVDWSSLRTLQAPSDLHLPQFSYTDPSPTAGQPQLMLETDSSLSQGFAFSALFQSSSVAASVSPGISLLQRSVAEAASSLDRASFIGFSWGPPIDAFNDQDTTYQTPINHGATNPTKILPFRANHSTLLRAGTLHSTPNPDPHHLSTPIRYSDLNPFGTLPRPSTLRRSAPRRSVSDREAMKQLVDCVGMSARKKVLESGRKPRILASFSRSGSVSKKELRFVSSPIPLPDYAAPSPIINPSKRRQRSGSLGGLRVDIPVGGATDVPSATDTESEGPPSPSPRPGSAMSRTSGTPTVSSIISRPGSTSLSLNGTSSMLLGVLPPGCETLEDRQRMGNGIRSQRNDMTEMDTSRVLGRRQRAVTVSSSAPSLFDTLEERHAILMKDIGELEQRLSTLARSGKRTV